MSISLDIIEMGDFGEGVYHVGHYRAVPDGGEPFEGYYMAMYRMEGGEWRIYRQIGNMVLPEPEANPEDAMGE